MSLPKNVAASVRARLLSRAKEQGMDYNLILTKYALERLLYRLSASPWGDAFVLKGALLFDLWFDQPHRPTRDMDLLGFGSSEMADVAAVFREVCALVDEDGMTFDPATVSAAEIRKEANYAGVRVTLLGRLDGARCAVQVDVGYGDAVTPEPQTAHYPVLLEDMSAPVLRVYPAYTVVAEKYHAMVSLGIVNTRLKDYFDLWFLARHFSFDPALLQDAIAATFARRSTPLPQHLPLGLSDAFAQDATKVQQWKAFLRKNKLQAPALDAVMDELRPLLWGNGDNPSIPT
jgi:predicted nucleotidyltransferase component of viral defense system